MFIQRSPICYTQHHYHISEAVSVPWYLSVETFRIELQHLNYTVLLSSPSRAVNSGCKRAKREQDESPCGGLASETATLWKPALEAPLWVSLDFPNVCVYVHKLALVWRCIICLTARRQERNTFYYSRPEVPGLLFLWHPAGLLWPWSSKGERWNLMSLCLCQFKFFTLVFKSVCAIFSPIVSSVLFISDHLLSDRAGSSVEKGGQRTAGQRFGHWL